MSRAKGNLPPVSQEAAPAQTLDSVLGFQVLEHGDGFINGSVAVTDRVRQPMGLVHGGVYAALAESLCSMATWQAVYEDGMIATGQQNDTSFLRPVTEGNVNAAARSRHRGRTTWVWEVDFTDDAGRLCAVSRVTIAVRPAQRS
jgi:1,4-dihydroxy-2-naphthoyl-CoA hydrolase